MSQHSHPGATPPPGHVLQVEHLAGGFRVRVENVSGQVVQTLPILPAEAIGRVARDWCQGRALRVRASDSPARAA